MLNFLKYIVLFLFIHFASLSTIGAQTLNFANEVQLIDHPALNPSFFHAFIPLDYNRDSILDLVGHNGSRTLLLTGMEDGEYGEQSFDRYYALKVMDFDRDGVQDDIVTEEHMHIRTDSGTYYTLDPQIGSFDDIFEAADFADNGYTDLVTLYNEGGSARYLELHLNEGDSVFTVQPLYDSGYRINDIDYGDVDNDGDLDIVLVQGDGPKGALLINSGDGTFETKSINPGAQVGRSNIDLKDMDRDGDPDVIMYNGSKIVVFENTDTLSTFSSYTEITNRFNSILHTADLNNDGLQDIIVDHNYDVDFGQISAFENLGGMEFGSREILMFYDSEGGILPSHPYAENLLSIFDVDFDGDQDILFTNTQGGSEVTLIENLHIDINTAVDHPAAANVKQISVSPNPAIDQIQLHFPTQMATTSLKYGIYSRDQRLVQNGHIEGEWKVPVSHLPGGLYYLLVWDSERQLSYFSEFVKSE